MAAPLLHRAGPVSPCRRVANRDVVPIQSDLRLDWTRVRFSAPRYNAPRRPLGMSLASGTRLGPYENPGLIAQAEWARLTGPRHPPRPHGSPQRSFPRIEHRRDARASSARAHAVAALSHPNICALFDVGEAGVRTDPEFVAAERRDGRNPSPNPESRRRSRSTTSSWSTSPARRCRAPGARRAAA